MADDLNLNGGGDNLPPQGGEDQSIVFQQQADNLLGQLKEGEAPDNNNQFPEKIGDMPLQEWEKTLETATGGQFNSYKDLQTTLKMREEFTKLQDEYAQLKAASGGPKYSNEYTKKLDELYANGATDQEIRDFERVQRLEIDKISDLEAVKFAIRKEYPGFSDQEVMEEIEHRYGGTDADSITNTLALKKDSFKARDLIQQMKVNTAQPESIRKQQFEQQRQQQLVESWNRVATNQIGGQEKQRFEVKIGEGDDAKVHAIDFSIPEADRLSLVQQVTNFAVQRNIPFTAEGWKEIQEFKQRALFFMKGPEIMEAMLRNSSASTKQETLEKVHNLTGEIPRGQENQHQLSDEMKSYMANIYEQGAKGGFS